MVLTLILYIPCEVKRPDHAPFVERFFGTLNRSIRDSDIKGYAHPLKDRPDSYNPDKEAEKGGLTTDTKRYEGFEYEYYYTGTRNDVMTISAVTANVSDSSNVVEIISDPISIYDKFSNGEFTFIVDTLDTVDSSISPKLDIYVVYADGTEERAQAEGGYDYLEELSISAYAWEGHDKLYSIDDPDEIVKEMYVVYSLQADHTDGTLWLADSRIEYTSQAINRGGNPRYQIDIPISSPDFLSSGDLIIPITTGGFNTEGTIITATSYSDTNLVSTRSYQLTNFIDSETDLPINSSGIIRLPYTELTIDSVRISIDDKTGVATTGNIIFGEISSDPSINSIQFNGEIINGNNYFFADSDSIYFYHPSYLVSSTSEFIINYDDINITPQTYLEISSTITDNISPSSRIIAEDVNGLTGSIYFDSNAPFRSIRIQDIIPSATNLSSLSIEFIPVTREGGLSLSLPIIVYKDNDRAYSSLNGTVYDVSSTNSLNTVISGFVSSPLISMRSDQTAGRKLTHQYNLVSDSNFTLYSDNGSIRNYDLWEDSGNIPALDDAEYGVSIPATGFIAQHWANSMKFTGGIASDLLIKFTAKSMTPNTDTSAMIELRVNDSPSSSYFFPITPNSRWKNYSELWQYQNERIDSIGWKVHGPTTGSISITNLEIIAAGYTDSDPLWYKYQDVDPNKLTSDDGTLQHTMAKMGWYESTITVDNVVQPWNDSNLYNKTYDPFSQFYYTDLYLDYSGILDTREDFSIDLKFTSLASDEMDTTLWVNGIKYDTSFISGMVKDISTGAILSQGDHIYSVKVRPGLNKVLLETVVGPLSQDNSIDNISDGLFRLSIDNPSILDYVRVSVPHPSQLRIPYVFYDPSLATADVDSVSTSYEFDFTNLNSINSTWEISTGAGVYIEDQLYDDTLNLVESDSNTFNSMYQSFPRTGEFEINTSIHLTNYECDEITLECAENDEYYRGGIIFNFNGEIFLISLGGIIGNGGDNKISLLYSDQFPLVNVTEVGSWLYPTGYSAGSEYEIKISLSSLPSDFTFDTQYINGTITIKPSNADSWIPLQSGSNKFRYVKYEHESNISNVEAGDKFKVGYFLETSTLSFQEFQLKSSYFRVSGSGDLDILALQANSQLLSGYPTLFGGSAYLRRYIQTDLSNMPEISAGQRPSKSIWRPIGTVIALNDALPVALLSNEIDEVWTGEISHEGSVFENWIQGGGKFVQATGSIPFKFVAQDNTLIPTVSWLNNGNNNLGHQYIFDIIDKNENGGFYDGGFYIDGQNDKFSSTSINNNPDIYDWKFKNPDNPLLKNGFGQIYNAVNAPISDDGEFFQTGNGYNPKVLVNYQFTARDIIKIDSVDYIRDISGNNHHLTNINPSQVTNIVDQYQDNYYLSNDATQNHYVDNLTINDINALKSGFSVEFTINNAPQTPYTISIGNLDLEISTKDSEYLYVKIIDNTVDNHIIKSTPNNITAEVVPNPDFANNGPLRLSLVLENYIHHYKIFDQQNSQKRGRFHLFFKLTQQNADGSHVSSYNTWNKVFTDYFDEYDNWNWDEVENIFKDDQTISLSSLDTATVLSNFIIYKSPKNYSNCTYLKLENGNSIEDTCSSNDLSITAYPTEVHYKTNEFKGDIDDSLLINSPLIGDSSNAVIHLTQSSIEGTTGVFDRYTIVNKQEFDLLEVESKYGDNVYGSRGTTSILTRDGSRASYLYFPDRYTTPAEHDLYYTVLSEDVSGRYDFIDERPYNNMIHYTSDYYGVTNDLFWGRNPNALYSNTFTYAGLTDDWNQADTYLDLDHDYTVQEYHAERLMLGTAAIQPYNSKGLIATLPLLNWNRSNISGVNSDYYINRIDSAGIMNTQYPEQAARNIFAKNIVSTAFQTALQLSITGVVKDNSNNSRHYLESFTGKLGYGDQYSGSDTNARFMVRIQQNNSQSIADSRILEGWDRETGHTDASYSYLTENNRTHYPLYQFASIGELGRTFWDVGDDGTTLNNVVYWTKSDFSFASLRDPLDFNAANNSQYTRPLYDSQRTFVTVDSYDDHVKTIFNKQVPDCDQEYYPRLSTGEYYSPNSFCSNENQFYAPQWTTLDLDSLINGIDTGRALFLPLSELDQNEFPLVINTKNVDSNFPNMFYGAYSGNYANGNLSADQTDLQVNNFDLRADGLTDWANPLQYLTVENISIYGDTGDQFIFFLLKDQEDQWVYSNTIGKETWLQPSENSTPSVFLSIGGFEDNLQNSGSSSTTTIWKKFDYGNEKTSSYMDHVTNSNVFDNTNLLILRSGYVRVDDFPPIGADNTKILGTSDDKPTITARSKVYGTEEQEWTIQDIEAIPRLSAERLNYLDDYSFCNEFNENGEWFYCSPEGTDRPISSDWYPEKGHYTGILSEGPTFQEFGQRTNNGGSTGGLLAGVNLSTGSLAIQNDSTDYSVSRSRYYNVNLDQQLIFSTQLFSRPERLLNYYGQFDQAVIDNNYDVWYILSHLELQDIAILLGTIIILLAVFTLIVMTAGLAAAGIVALIPGLALASSTGVALTFIFGGLLTMGASAFVQEYIFGIPYTPVDAILDFTFGGFGAVASIKTILGLSKLMKSIGRSPNGVLKTIKNSISNFRAFNLNTFLKENNFADNAFSSNVLAKTLDDSHNIRYSYKEKFTDAVNHAASNYNLGATNNLGDSLSSFNSLDELDDLFFKFEMRLDMNIKDQYILRDSAGNILELNDLKYSFGTEDRYIIEPVYEFNYQTTNLRAYPSVTPIFDSGRVPLNFSEFIFDDLSLYKLLGKNEEVNLLMSLAKIEKFDKISRTVGKYMIGLMGVYFLYNFTIEMPNLMDQYLNTPTYHYT